MSFKVVQKVDHIDHIEGCRENKSCGPECVRVLGPWRVEFWLMFPGERRAKRKRENIPEEWTGGAKARLQWAREREAHWIQLGRDFEVAQANITVRQFAKEWNERRRSQEKPADKEWQLLNAHVLPLLGAMPVVDVRPIHALEMVETLKTKVSERINERLAPRTIRGIFFLAKQLFGYAVIKELIPGNPMVLERGVLPGKRDKDPSWRKNAVFTQREVELLISSELVPLYRRVAYALLFLLGMRIGQIHELRWGDYEPGFKPLGRMSSSRSWESVKKKVKGTKTEADHLIPVLPVLAAILAEWRMLGWPERYGRKPKDSDLIVPTIHEGNQDSRITLTYLKDDLKALGLRDRRQHDARRTFISLAISGGAPKDLIRYITHPKPMDVFDEYMTPTWKALCKAVQCITVKRRAGNLVMLALPPDAEEAPQDAGETEWVDDENEAKEDGADEAADAGKP